MRCAVLGKPIAHSLSPALHRAAYAELGLDWSYDALEVDSADLEGFLHQLGPEWRGLSLTMPLKRTVVPLVDELTDRAAQAQAANTVVLTGQRRTGHNTDIPGAAAALRERYGGSVDSAVVLGGGATAASLLLALADLGCTEARLVVRSTARATDTIEALARHPHPPRLTVVETMPTTGAVVLVSTIPAHAQGDDVLALVGDAALVFEVIYHPWPTPLAQQSAAAGIPLVGGLDLLVHQAALQVELMTGQPAPLAAMRAAGEQALEQ